MEKFVFGWHEMSQALAVRGGLGYHVGMTRKPEMEQEADEVPEVDPLARLLQCHPETVYDYLEFRRMMAGPAAALAAERATPEDIERLRVCLKAMEESHDLEDPSREAAADAEFHLAIYEAAHNEVMIRIMRQFLRMVRQGVFYDRINLYQRRGVRDSFLRQHQAIFHAIAAGNPEAARSTADAHLAWTMEALREAQRADARLEVALRRQQSSKLVTNKGKRED
jgi:GntR family transcriptional repressor for pyruvate dehydrogenase complex